MTTELIAVIEFKFDSSERPALKPDSLVPYMPGLDLYKISDLSELNLKIVVAKHTQHLRNAEYNREDASALFGGYILRVKEEDVYFPQCCGDLSDIRYWETLLTANQPISQNGHPAPKVKIGNNTICFDFCSDVERFRPLPRYKTFDIAKVELQDAVIKVNRKLESLAIALIAINDSEQLGIETIDRLLIWGDT